MITQKDIMCKTPQEIEDGDFIKIFRRLQQSMLETYWVTNIEFYSFMICAYSLKESLQKRIIDALKEEKWEASIDTENYVTNVKIRNPYYEKEKEKEIAPKKWWQKLFKFFLG